MSDSACRKCGEEGHMARECPSGGGGDNKCRNCRQEGHKASDCPEPEVCRRCRKPGHMKDDCPEPEKCYNCRQEGHSTQDCPEPQLCRRCKKEGHTVSECTEPQVCNRCGQEGHMVRECTEEEKTRAYTDEEGKIREIYVPKAEEDASELYGRGIASGINFSKYENIPVSVTGENKPKPIGSFAAACLRPLLMENVLKSGYEVPTPIQKNAIPIVMGGRDLMACAQTGSGKTAAFLLPIIHKLIEADAESSGSGTPCPQCVVISPTRELAVQIHNQARKFAQGSMVKSVVMYGGTSVNYQAALLRKGCNILVATPGRFIAELEKGVFSVENLQFLVLDEADRMLDMGFMNDIQNIVEKCPAKGKRQTLMFSATFPDDIQQAAQEFLVDYLFLTVGMVGGVCSDVEQVFHEVSKFEKRDKLEELMQDPSRDSKERTLVFVQTKKNADFLATYLSGEGLPTTSIHGDRLQREREEALYDFTVGKMPILVATGVAARGLDIPGVAHVINYDMPNDVDEYVHRIGRTGRMGNLGKATSFFDAESDAEIAGPLVKLLSDAGTDVPDWLQSAGGGGAAEGGDEDW